MGAVEPSAMTYKKATAGLDEAARARLRGPFASGAASLGRVCRSSWERTGSVPAGVHEYVDVAAATRYIVEGFREHQTRVLPAPL
uniref:Uncharacterized protein n=1 Tax=Oryza brachyantha TaxID=4533 RepID=J3LGJ3_ORYBR